MSDQGVAAALSKLAAAFRLKLDGDLIASYLEAFQGCQPELLTVAVRRCIAEEPHFPAAAVVLGYYGVVRNEANQTQAERRYLEAATIQGATRDQQALINRRGRRLLREIAARVAGADVLDGLPGDDAPLSEEDAREIEAQADLIVTTQYESRRAFYAEMARIRAFGKTLTNRELADIRRKHNVPAEGEVVGGPRAESNWGAA